jgi:hypothetical protein
MHFWKMVGIFLSLCALCTFAAAGENKMGIHDVSRVKFDVPVHVGSAVLPAGEYEVRHTMEGQDHIMVFQRLHQKEQFKVKCTLVALPRKAARDEASYQLKAGDERVLQELVFRGDTSKHVF